MSEPLVRKEVEGGVCVLTLDRPDVLNALDTNLMRQLTDVLTDVAHEEDVRCVVLTGAGRAFCAGGDIRAIAKASSDRIAEVKPRSARSSSFERRVQWVRRGAEASRLLHEMPKPTIAMINGACAGAGMSLAAACDFRYAAESAVFRSAFTASGISGDYGGSWLWTRILGTAKARQLFLLDQKRSAAQALSFGLVDEVHEDESLAGAVMARAHQLAALPGKAAQYAKANLNAALTEKFSDSLDRESLNMMLSREAMVAEARERKEREAEQEQNEPRRRMGTGNGG